MWLTFTNDKAGRLIPRVGQTASQACFQSRTLRGFFTLCVLWCLTQPAVFAQLGDNLALGKPARGSSTYAANRGALYAVDGNTATSFSSQASTNPWLTVDLGNSQPIGTVRVTPHASQAGYNQLTNFYVFASNTPLPNTGNPATDLAQTQANAAIFKFQYSGVPTGPVSVPVNLNYRYVRIQSSQTNNILVVSELEVFHQTASGQTCPSGTRPSPVTGSVVTYVSTASAVQSGGTAGEYAVNLPDGYGVQIYANPATPGTNIFWLDLGTVVPAGQKINLWLSNTVNSAYDGHIIIQSYPEYSGTGSSTLTITIPATSRAAQGTVDQDWYVYEYTVPAGGARVIALTPQSGTAFLVDGATYGYETCDCATSNFIQTSTFEGFERQLAYATTIGAWQVTQDNVHVWSQNLLNGWPGAKGTLASVDLDGNGGNTGGIQQTVTGLVPGRTYNLSFYMAYNQAGGSPSSSMRLDLLNGATAFFTRRYTSHQDARLGFNNVYVSFVAPSSSVTIRFTSLTGTGGGLPDNGGVPGYGVVIDEIELRSSSCSDFGDLPTAYNTTVNNNGAEHTLTSTFLGASVDADKDGFPGTAANGDDQDGSDDEDAFTSLASLAPGAPYTLTVPVSSTAGGSTVCGWIDFNNTAPFAATDGVCATVPQGATTATLVWPGTITAGAAQGVNLPLRLRIERNGTFLAGNMTTVNFAGLRGEGEVEDYTLCVPPSVTAVASSSTTCSGDAVNINYTTTPANQQVLWVRQPGNITGLGNVTDYPTASGATPESFTYTATVSTGTCSTTAATVVTVNPRPIVTPSVCSQTICSGQTGNITFTSSIPGSTIHWVRTPTAPAPASGTGDISQSFINTGPTSVTYTYKIWADSPAPASCPSSTTITCEIVVTPGLTVTAMANSATVCVGSPLSLSASVAQTGSYSYGWTGPNGFVSNQQNPQVSSSVTAAMSGSYTVVVTDAAGCSGTAVVNAVVQNCCDLMVSATPTSITSCQTPNTGAITITYTGSGMYEYRLNGSSAQTLGASPASISNLTAGSYTLVVQTVGDPTCSRALETFVLPPPATIIAATSNSPICSGSSLSLMATSGFVSYNWTGPNGFTSSQQNPSIPAATTATSGVYTVQVVNVAGCTGSSSTTVNIADQPNLTITGTTGMTVCSGQSTTINVGGANGAVVTWTNNLGQSGTGTTIDFAGILNNSGQPQTITYDIIANAGACSDRETVTLTVKPAPFLLVVPQQAVICATEQSNIVATATPSTAAITWTRTPAGGTGTGSLTINETLPAGSYNYTLTATTGGCSNTVTVPLTVNN